MSKKDEALKLALDYLLSKQTGAHIIAAIREALASEAKEQPAQQALDKMAENARELGLDYEPVPENFMDALKFDVAMREALAEQPAQQEQGAWADECRISLVTAIHFLASDYENALGVFRDDTEARRKAEGDIAYARKIAAKWNWNGTSPPAQRKPLTDEQIEALLVNWPEDGIAFFDFARAIEAAHGIKGDA